MYFKWGKYCFSILNVHVLDATVSLLKRNALSITKENTFYYTQTHLIRHREHLEQSLDSFYPPLRLLSLPFFPLCLTLCP